MKIKLLKDDNIIRIENEINEYLEKGWKLRHFFTETVITYSGNSEVIYISCIEYSDYSKEKL